MSISHEIYLALALEEFKRQGSEAIKKGEQFALTLEYNGQTINTNFKLINGRPNQTKTFIPLVKKTGQKIKIEDKA